MNLTELILWLFIFSEYFKHERRKHNSIHHSSKSHSNKSPHSYHGNTGDRDHSNAAHSRHKRSMSWERNVEVLVVADYQMARYHGNDLQHYVLTLMSIVSSTFFTLATCNRWTV